MRKSDWLVLLAVLGLLFPTAAFAQSLPPVSADKAALMARIDTAVAENDAIRLKQQVGDYSEMLARDTADFAARQREIEQSKHKPIWDRTYGWHTVAGSMAGLFRDASGDLILASNQGQIDPNARCERPTCGYRYIRLVRLNEDGTAKTRLTDFRLIDGGARYLDKMTAAMATPDGGFLIGVHVYTKFDDLGQHLSQQPLPRLMKLDKTGNVEWSRDFEPLPGDKNYAKIRNILLLENGDTLMVIATEFKLDGRTDVYRVDPQGETIWTHRIDDVALQQAPSLELDNGDLLVGLRPYRKLSAAGEPKDGGEVFGSGLLTRTSDGDIVSARFNGEKYQGAYGKFDRFSTDNVSYRLVYLTIEKRNQRGELIWSNDTFGVEGRFANGVDAIEVLPSGDILVLGSVTKRTIVGSETFAALIAPDGRRKWIRYLLSSGSLHEVGADIVVDPNGDIFLGSETQGVTAQSRTLKGAEPPFQEAVSRVTKLEAR